MSIWPLVQIKDCGKVVGGATPRTSNEEFWGGDISWVTPKDISDLDANILDFAPRKITAKGMKSCSAEILPINSVLLSSRAPIGLVAINKIPVATNQGFKSIIPSEKLDAGFLFWWLKANKAKLDSLGNGATFKEISKAIVEKIEIPLPPLEEQKRIAAILDKADELRRLRQESIKKLNTLSQSIFYEMFGDHIAFANNWERTKILDCCEVNPKRDFDLQDSDKVSFLPMAAVSEEGFIFEEQVRDYSDVKKGFTHFRKNDVLVAKITPCFENGKGTIAQIKTSEVGFGTTEFHVIRPSPNVTSRYIFDILHSNKFRKFAIPKMSGSAGQKRVPADVIKNYEIYLPALELLSKYEIISRKIEVQKNQIKTELLELDSLFQSLQHRAFNGEL